MLALNVSAEVVEGFRSVGTAMTNSNINLQTKLDDTYANFDMALQNSEDKVRLQYDKAQEVKALSHQLESYIDSLEYEFIGKLTDKADVILDKHNPKATRTINFRNSDGTLNHDSIKVALQLGGFTWMEKGLDDTHEAPKFFLQGTTTADGIGSAIHLKEKVIAYRQKVKEILGEDSAKVNFPFDVEQTFLNKDKKEVTWEQKNFDEVVAGAGLVTLIRMKAETMNAEFDAVNMLYKQVSKGDFSFDKIALISRPKSTYIIRGGVYETDINVAAYDSRQKFNATVNGQQLISNDSGSVHYRTVCNNVGQQKVNVTAYVTSPDGGTKEYTYSDNYFVAEPVGVISLDNMQVMYSGIENPLTASVPGVDGRNVEVKILEGQGKLNKVEGNGKYMITPANGCKKIVLGVDATIEKGKTTRMNTLTFKVKPIPAPEITVAGFKNGAKVSRKSLTSGVTVTARAQEGFEFKIPRGSIRVMSLEVFVGNKPFNFNGSTFEPDGLSAIRNANRGDNIYITAKVMMPDGVPQNANCVLTITK
jgi:gliding motility-associated protein GldM